MKMVDYWDFSYFRGSDKVEINNRLLLYDILTNILILFTYSKPKH